MKNIWNWVKANSSLVIAGLFAILGAVAVGYKRKADSLETALTVDEKQDKVEEIRKELSKEEATYEEKLSDYKSKLDAYNKANPGSQ